MFPPLPRPHWYVSVALVGGGSIHRLGWLCWQFPGSSSSDGSGVGRALAGVVALVFGGSAVNAEEEVVKAGGFQQALRATA